LGELLEREGYGGSFVEWYLVPMAAAIWSAPPGKIMDFPAQAFLQFCENHGLLHITGKPTWRTVVHGSRSYVERLADGISGDITVGLAATRVSRPADGPLVELGDGSTRRYDALVLACHSDEALALLADPSAEEQAILGAVTYLPNHVVLHTDESFLPRRKLARAAWNYYATECTLDAGAGHGQPASRAPSRPDAAHLLIRPPRVHARVHGRPTPGAGDPGDAGNLVLRSLAAIRVP
jgi:predicted NAD/FAD-binding protein